MARPLALALADMGGSYPPYGNSTYDTHDYRQLYKMLAEHYRLWIYNGQDDGCVPYIGAQEWTARLGFPETTAWHPWFTTAVGGGRSVLALSPSPRSAPGLALQCSHIAAFAIVPAQTRGCGLQHLFRRCRKRLYLHDHQGFRHTLPPPRLLP